MERWPDDEEPGELRQQAFCTRGDHSHLGYNIHAPSQHDIHLEHEPNQIGIDGFSRSGTGSREETVARENDRLNCALARGLVWRKE